MHEKKKVLPGNSNFFGSTQTENIILFEVIRHQTVSFDHQTQAKWKSFQLGVK